MFVVLTGKIEKKQRIALLMASVGESGCEAFPLVQQSGAVTVECILYTAHPFPRCPSLSLMPQVALNPTNMFMLSHLIGTNPRLGPELPMSTLIYCSSFGILDILRALDRFQGKV